MESHGRRRVAVAVACALVAAAFATGAGLGNGGVADPSQARRLTLSQLAGERIIAGFNGPVPPPSLRRLIRSGRIAGVVLYADNLPGRDAGRRLVRRLQAIPRPSGLQAPLLMLTDQEGGLVKRLNGAPAASAEVMGRRGPAFSRRQGRLTARNLRNVGFNVDLAPVLDVARPGSDIASDHRGFGSTAAAVTATALPFAEGLQAGGVAATAKNFPGIGSARFNTDLGAQRIGLSRGRLRRIDEAPFGPFVAAAGDLVMLSTAIYPAFSQRPAAFSRVVATRELRERLGFRGVSTTDALDTGAVIDFGGPTKAGVAAARAGADLLLYTEPGPAAHAQRALLAGLRSGRLSKALFAVAAGRVLGLRHSLARR